MRNAGVELTLEKGLARGGCPRAYIHVGHYDLCPRAYKHIVKLILNPRGALEL